MSDNDQQQAITMANAVQAAWQRLYDRIVQAQADGYRLPPGLFEAAMQRVGHQLDRLEIMPRKFEDDAMTLIGAYEAETQRIDHDYPRKRR